MNNNLSFLVLTLGCKLNQLESEALIDVFKQAGFKIAANGGQFEDGRSSPSIIIINTCTVTSKADQKARRVIRKALRDHPDSRVIVTGCYAQLNQEELLKLNTETPQRLFVISKNNIVNLPEHINKTSEFFSAVNNWKMSIPHSSINISHHFQFNPDRFSSHTRSFLKIQDGCDKHCTYCRIRLARGPGISLEKEEVLSRLRLLEENHAEAVLTGVNISQYKIKNLNTEKKTIPQGNENSWINLAKLLDYLLKETNKINIRLSSLAPDSIDEELADVLSHKRIRPHFHLSIQSGSEKILEKMGRCYNAEIIEKAVSLLRGAKDDPFLACDIITGFPGETNEDFEETFSLCQKIDFAWIHVFPYSKRPDTPAFSFTDNVIESEVTKRTQFFTGLAKKGRMNYIRRWLGREVDVLIEKEDKLTTKLSRGRGEGGEIVYSNGISENYIKALVRCEKVIPPPGSVLRCILAGEYRNTEDFEKNYTFLPVDKN